MIETSSMKVIDVLSQTGLARSKSEANRMVKQGQIRVGGCEPGCLGWQYCHCGGWRRVQNPQEGLSEPAGANIRVGDGHWQCKPKLDDGRRFDQFPGIAKIPTHEEEK